MVRYSSAPLSAASTLDRNARPAAREPGGRAGARLGRATRTRKASFPIRSPTRADAQRRRQDRQKARPKAFRVRWIDEARRPARRSEPNMRIVCGAIGRMKANGTTERIFHGALSGKEFR